MHGFVYSFSHATKTIIKYGVHQLPWQLRLHIYSLGNLTSYTSQFTSQEPINVDYIPLGFMPYMYKYNQFAFAC